MRVLVDLNFAQWLSVIGLMLIGAFFGYLCGLRAGVQRMADARQEWMPDWWDL